MPWRVMVHEDEAALAEAAAGQLAHAAASAIAARGRFTVALAGGSTPTPLYELLGTPAWRERVPWLQTHLFWTDERFVSTADTRSNYGTVRRALLSHLEMPPANVHPIPTSFGSPDEAAARYEQELRRIAGGGTAVPELDLLLLGLGADGHTASLFPRSDLLRVEDRLVAADPVPRSGTARITMTFPLLNASRLALVLVSGASKASVLRDVLFGDDDPDRLPAQRVQPKSGFLECHLDRAAATGLHP